MNVAARCLALFFLLLSSTLLAQESAVDAIVKEGKENSQVMAHLEHLCRKIGARLTSSDRLTQAQEWAKDQFESFGLKNCRLEEWGTFPVGFNRGPWSGSMTTSEGRVELTCATMSWTAGTEGAKSGAAYLLPKDDSEIDKDKAKGAWVVISGGGGSKSALSACEEAGALGYVRASMAGELIITDGSSRISWDKLPKRVTVHVIKSQHQKIVELLKNGKEVTLQFDIKNDFKQGPIKLYNVIAEIPGTDKPDEVVIVGGHIDSWDGAQGATDNGTGTATTIEAARLLAKTGAKPKRTIRFMLWSGEEQGCLGSAAWCRKHKDELAKVSCVLVHDGGTNFVAGIGGTEPMVPLFEKVFEPVKSIDEQMPFKVRKVGGLSPGSSDHDSFLAAGVPGFFWDQRGTAKKKQNYGHEHHTQHDTYEAAIPEFQQHSSIVIAVGALGIANLDTLLPRDGMRGPGGGGAGPGGRRLGIDTTSDDDLTITTVMDEGVASRAGLKEGDKLLKVADKAVKTRAELRSALQAAPAETTVTVLREGKETTLPVKFAGGGGGPRMLGVNCDDDLILTTVVEGSAAEKAGLKEGDQVLKLGDTVLHDMQELRDAIQASKPETTVTIKRDGKEMTLPVKFDK